MYGTIRSNFLRVLVLLGSALVIATPAAAQEPPPATAALTGTAYRLVDQTIVDSVVVDETELPVTDGRIAIPELDIDVALAKDGSFRLSDLPVDADTDRPTEATVVFTAPGLGSFTYLHLRLYPGPVGPNLTPQMIDTPRVNDRSIYHAHSEDTRGFNNAGAGDPAARVSGQQNACGLPREPGEIAVLGRTNPAVAQGTVRIPELNLTSEIVAGCFEFRNLTLPQDPMLVSFEIRVEGFRPTTWANFIVLSMGTAPNFTPRLKTGDVPELIDPCADLLSTPREKLSAAGNQQAQLCAQLTSTGALPDMGGGAAAIGSGAPLAPALLALAGAALICAGAAMRRAERAR